jgi:hypothetical protein
MPKARSAVEVAETREQKMTRQYSMATQWLREAHPDEFTALRVKASAELGLDWTPKPSPEKKAEAEFDALLEQFPHLRHRFGPDPEEPEEDLPLDLDA